MTLARLLERLEATDVAALDSGGVAAAMRDLQRLKGFVAQSEHSLARRANELAAAGSGVPASELIARNGHCSPREAEKTSRRAETLGAFPAISAQLDNGRLSTEHADAITTATARLDDNDRHALNALDDELAHHAARSTPGQFKRFVERVIDQLAADRGTERSTRQRNATQLTKGINDETGMYWLHAEYDPETGARLFRPSTPKPEPWHHNPTTTHDLANTSPRPRSPTSPQPPAAHAAPDAPKSSPWSTSQRSPTASTTPRSANSTTEPPCQSRPCAGSPATHTSSPSS